MKGETSRCVKLPSYQLHGAINEGLLGHIFRMCHPVNLLGFITCVFCFPHLDSSGMPEGRSC